jgi:hypothetical protein
MRIHSIVHTFRDILEEKWNVEAFRKTPEDLRVFALFLRVVKIPWDRQV